MEISSQINVFIGVNSSTNDWKFVKIASKRVEIYINFWWNKGELFLPFGSHSAADNSTLPSDNFGDIADICETIPAPDLGNDTQPGSNAKPRPKKRIQQQ